MKRRGSPNLFFRSLLVVPCFLVIGCPLPPPPDPLFSFVILADPHVYGGPGSENAVLLSQCVDWINTNEVEYQIRFVSIVGDIAWGDGFETAQDILEDLSIPWIPVIGDNVIQSGEEADFDSTWASQYAYLASVFDHWQKSPTPVWNPELGLHSHFQNFSFDYEGLHFIGIDWCTRVIGLIVGEQADLHDFPGGTLPWFKEDITSCPKESKENIIMLSHHPMHVSPGAFTTPEDQVVEAFTATFGDHVYANLAGHYHIDFHETRPLGQYELYVTEATHLGPNNLRLVRVYSDGTAFTYHHEHVEVPGNRSSTR